MNTCSPAINTAKNPAQFIPSYLIEKESKQAFLSIITIKSLIFPSNFLLTCKNSWTRLPWADNKGHNSFSITKTKTKSLQKRIFSKKVKMVNLAFFILVPTVLALGTKEPLRCQPPLVLSCSKWAKLLIKLSKQ